MESGQISAGDVFKTFFVLVSTGKVIADAGSMTSDLAKGSTAVASVFEILDRQSLIPGSYNVSCVFVDSHQYSQMEVLQFLVYFCLNLKLRLCRTYWFELYLGGGQHGRNQVRENVWWDRDKEG